MFRANFLIEAITGLAWACMNLGFYWIVFEYTDSIGRETGWGKYEFFVFLGTTWIVNSIVQTFFMPNLDEFSELIRTGGLDFVLLKPIDSQFLISLRKINWSGLSFLGLGGVTVWLSIQQLCQRAVSPWQPDVGTFIFYPLFILCGVTVLYSLMICLAATSVWLGRNQTLYDFWFYITNFSRYPMEIYTRGWGLPLYFLFTYVIPVLIVVNVPARIMAQPIYGGASHRGWLPVFMLCATVITFFASRWVFNRSLSAYRSASS